MMRRIKPDVNKNIFKIISEVSICRMDNITDKHANIVDSQNFYQVYSEMHERGFEFYKSDCDPKILTINEILCYYFVRLT